MSCIERTPATRGWYQFVNRLRQEIDEHGYGNTEERHHVLERVQRGDPVAWGLASQACEVDYDGPIRLMVPGTGLGSAQQAQSVEALRTRPKHPKPKRVHWADQAT